MTSDERAIRDLHKTWIEAVNAGHLDRLLALATEDALFFNPGRAPASRKDFPAGFSQAHEKFQVRCVSELKEAVVIGDIAYTLCEDSLQLTPRAGGDAIRSAGQRMTIYRKQSDGRWLLSRDIHTLSAV